MSFILDALKKSDAERQKRSTPGFADIPVSRDRRPPQRWVWVVGGLLAVNLVALLALFVRPDRPTAGEAALVEEAAPPAPEASRPFADIVAEAKQKQPEARRTPPESARRESRPEAAASATSDPEPQRDAGTEAPSAGTADTAEPENTFESLRAGGRLELPDLHLDIHVYSAKPAERFVFINMKKYRENETLAEGPTVSRIAPEGVILDHRGTVFLLPRE